MVNASSVKSFKTPLDANWLSLFPYVPIQPTSSHNPFLLHKSSHLEIHTYLTLFIYHPTWSFIVFLTLPTTVPWTLLQYIVKWLLVKDVSRLMEGGGTADAPPHWHYSSCDCVKLVNNLKYAQYSQSSRMFGIKWYVLNWTISKTPYILLKAVLYLQIWLSRIYFVCEFFAVNRL